MTRQIATVTKMRNAKV